MDKKAFDIGVSFSIGRKYAALDGWVTLQNKEGENYRVFLEGGKAQSGNGSVNVPKPTDADYKNSKAYKEGKAFALSALGKASELDGKKDAAKWKRAVESVKQDIIKAVKSKDVVAENRARAKLEVAEGMLRFSEQPTNAVKIENMNAAQLASEIKKVEGQISEQNKIISKNNITGSERVRQFPMGVGGSGWSASQKRAEAKEINRDVNKAVAATEATKKRDALQARLDALKKAHSEATATGKTASQAKAEREKEAVAKAGSSMKWKTTQRREYVNGVYKPQTIESGEFKIRGGSGLYDVYKGDKMIGRTDTLAKAKAIAEITSRK